MAHLKRIGRNRRRIGSAVDNMHPDKLYALVVGDKRMVRTGREWKDIKSKA